MLSRAWLVELIPSVNKELVGMVNVACEEALGATVKQEKLSLTAMTSKS